MKNLYQLQSEIKDLNECLKHSTVALRQAHNNSVRLIELLHARTQIIVSIAHRQAQVIRIYEEALMNVTPIRRAS